MSNKNRTKTQIGTLGGTRDGATGILYFNRGALGAIASYDWMIDAIYHLSRALDGTGRVRLSNSGGAYVRIAPIEADIDGTHYSYAGGDVDLSAEDDDTSYVWAYVSGGNLVIGHGADGDGWPATSHLKLATVPLAGGVITDEPTDMRPVLATNLLLAAIAALTPTDGNIMVGNGTTWVAESGATARTSLGLAIGADVQAYNANLTTYAGIAPSANVQSILGAADYAAILTLLSLDTMAQQAQIAADADDSITAAASITDNSGGTDPGDDTIAAIADPSDTPADADALRDDLVANTLVQIRAAIAQLAAKNDTNVTAITALATELHDLKAKMRTSGALAT